jgi:hypothetical protein
VPHKRSPSDLLRVAKVGVGSSLLHVWALRLAVR